MNKTLLALALIMFSLFFAINLEAKENGKIQEISCEKANKKGDKKMQDVKLIRYSDFSTSTMFIAVKIKNTTTNETAEIAIDNSSWLLKCKDLGLVSSSKEYPEYMKAHSDKVFEVPEKLFQKLSPMKSDGSFDFLKKDPSKIKEYLLETGPEPNSFFLDETKCRPIQSFICAVFAFDDTVIQQRCIDGKMFLKIIK